MERREFLKTAGLLAAVPFLGSFAETPSVPDRPNVLIILSDDEPYHLLDPKAGFAGTDPSQYWFPKTRTAFGPGLEFTRGYVSSPLCGPSRASLLTGLYPHNTGITTNSHTCKRFKNAGYASEQKPDLGLLLRNAGYDTAFIGKYVNVYEEVGAWVPPGYREWYGLFTNRNPVRANKRGKVGVARGSGGNPIARKNETKWLTDKVLEFIASDHGGLPWFTVASVSSPHSPYSPSDAHAGAFNNTPMPERPNFNYRADPNKPAGVRNAPGMGQEDQQKLRDEWRGKMEERLDLDDAVERLFAAVSLEDTYVFYLTDNGYMLGEMGLHKKARIYEESSRTPLLVRGPGVKENAKSDALVSLVDVTATVMELAGQDPSGMDGRSLVPLMFEAPAGEGEEATVPEWRNALLIEQAEDNMAETSWRAVRTADRVYVEHDTAETELYDMQNDPYQLANVAGTRPDEEAELSRRLGALRNAEGEALRSAERA